MSFSSSEVNTIKEEFFDALRKLASANSQDNSKGRYVKEWFNRFFKENGRVGLVNEAKRAGNRVKEQLGKRDVNHAIFVLADAKATDPLVKTLHSVLYSGLKTVLLVSYEGGEFNAINFYESQPSSVGNFYRKAFNLSPTSFTPKILGNQSQVADQQTVPISIEKPTIGSDDSVLLEVQQLLDDGFAGVVFSGPPGTSKSWYAREVALSLVDGDLDRVSFVQFHPGYQYEDFIEGYVPNEKGGFDPIPRTFLRMCNVAMDTSERVVIVVDELSRTDVVRVFGEALTYLETSKRQIPFTLASGKTIYVPHNLVVVATMNPWDRGVDELDLALERRFAKIRFDPKVDELRKFLVMSGLDDITRNRLELFFFKVSRHENPLCRIGHAYFRDLGSLESLKRRWTNQLSFHFERVLRDSPEDLKDIKNAWDHIFSV